MQTEQIGDLAKALALSQSKMSLVTKDSDNPYFKSKYAGLDAIMHEFQKSFAPNGLAVSQEFVPNDNVELMSLRTTLMHSSGQWISGIQTIKAKGSGVQDVMSASTYARRYGVCAITGIASTDEDDDGNAASGKTTDKPALKVPTPPVKKEGIGAIKTIVASKITQVKPGEFVIKSDVFPELYCNKEVVARIVRDNLGKSMDVSYTVDKDMFNILLDVVKV